VNTTLAAPAWKSYRVGTIVRLDDGRNFTINEISIVHTDRGYNSRRFTLVGPGGKTVIKSSRGITLWVAGLEDDKGEPTPAVKPIEKPPVSDTGRIQHAYFQALLRIVKARRNAWLCGPAGSGKTTSAHEVATLLGLPFYAKSVGPQVTESSLIGYQDANGKTVRTQLREAFEHGGVFLLDEVDAASPAVLVVINALLANGVASFPDAVVEKHPDFVLIAGANTIGLGADRQYVGRQQIDAATLDRFVLLDWPYDPRIEAAAAGVPIEAVWSSSFPVEFSFDEPSENNCFQYVERVVAIRNAVAKFGKAVRVIVSPRASINGTALIRQGFTIEDALNLCVWKGLDTDTRSKIEGAC
jgi:cobaltochelatase CobS